MWSLLHVHEAAARMGWQVVAVRGEFTESNARSDFQAEAIPPLDRIQGQELFLRACT